MTAAEGGRNQSVTEQTVRDRIQAQKRLDNCRDRFDDMAGRLKPYPKASLLGAAKVMCDKMNIPVPDRICLRGRQPLICFYCKYFPEFPFGFPLLINAANTEPGRQDQAISRRIAERDGASGGPRDFIGLLTPWPAEAQRPDMFMSKDVDFLDFWLTLD
jgi:hypothetical protein